METVLRCKEVCGELFGRYMPYGRQPQDGVIDVSEIKAIDL